MAHLSARRLAPKPPAPAAAAEGAAAPKPPAADDTAALVKQWEKDEMSAKSLLNAEDPGLYLDADPCEEDRTRAMGGYRNGVYRERSLCVDGNARTFPRLKVP